MICQVFVVHHHIVRRGVADLGPVAVEHSTADKKRRGFRRIDGLNRPIDAVGAGPLPDREHGVQPAVDRPLIVVDEAEEIGIGRRGVDGTVARQRNSLLRLDHVDELIGAIAAEGLHSRFGTPGSVVVDHQHRQPKWARRIVYLGLKHIEELGDPLRSAEGQRCDDDVHLLGSGCRGFVQEIEGHRAASVLRRIMAPTRL